MQMTVEKWFYMMASYDKEFKRERERGEKIVFNLIVANKQFFFFFFW
jgi:hypothetical protein